jgi:hypothetical protein
MYEGCSSETYLHVQHDDVKATVIPAAAQAVLCSGKLADEWDPSLSAHGDYF